MEVYFEGAIFGQENMCTLADRATHAAGRMLERYATSAARVVPRDALLAVGTFDFRRGQITLTGDDSERAVAAWLGTPQLDPRGACPGGATGREGGGRRASGAGRDRHLNRSLGEALIERGGVRHERDGVWIDGEGRRTSAIAEALIWALVTIAEGE